MTRIRLETKPAGPFDRCYYDSANPATVRVDGVPVCRDHAGRELADSMMAAKILTHVLGPHSDAVEL